MKLDEVRKNYDRIAGRYDRWTELVFDRLLRVEQYRERTVDLLGDLTNRVVLDVGCGTGRNLPLLVPRVGAGGRVIGLDYSEGMLNEARALVRREQWTNVELVRGDAATLEAVNGSVDAVISVWCMGIVDKFDAALQHAVDILHPGGRIAIMDFDRARPDRGPLHWLYPVYSRVLQWVGIDSAEDLDDERLRARWERGRAILRSRLDDIHEERYLSGGGVIIAGRARSWGGREN